MLTVRDSRRGRSKSPGARERSTSRDNREYLYQNTRAQSPPRKESKKSSKRYSESESEAEDRRQRESKPSKKYYESDSDDRKAKSKKSSKKYSYGEGGSESESDEANHRRKSSSKKYYDSDADGQEKSHKAEKRAPHRRDEEEVESDRRHREKSSRSKKYYESDSGNESPRQKQSYVPVPPKERLDDNHHGYEDGRHHGYEDGRQQGYGPPPAQYGYTQPSQYMQPAPDGPPQARHMSHVDPRHEQWRDQWAAVPESERPGFVPLPGVVSPSQPFSPPGSFPAGSHSDIPDHQRIHSIASPIAGSYNQQAQFQYAQVDPNIRYNPRPEKQYVQNPQQSYGMPSYTNSNHAEYVEIKPGTGKNERQEKRYRHENGPAKKDLTTHLGRLSLSTGAAGLGAAGLGAGLLGASPTHGDGGRPPASPLLETYRGTYQSISPMPSPTMLAKKKHDEYDSSDLSDLDLSKKSKSAKKSDKKSKSKDQEVATSRPHRPSTSSAGEPEIIMATPRTPKRVSFYDPVPDAIKLAAALAGTHHAPSTRPIISILPQLSTEDMLALRAEYKNHAKSSGKGINLAKHIKLRVPGNLGKAAYAAALGRWESEAYWANSWYQSGGSRRELLIESLMGRSNGDIREIKNCFKDKRYADDLEKCMRSELKADKFRVAILLALEENRMSDLAALDVELVKEDAKDLYRALTSREGGETAMIHIIVLRSDSHLREVLRAFEEAYKMNFAREMISKSRNLVGETLAHILNGALNRPMRDALLLHQAIAETAPGKERAELLISRAVRLHWEPRHMERVLRVYRERYGVELGKALGREVWSTMKTTEGREWVEFVAGCLGVEGELDDYAHAKSDRRGSGGRELERGDRDRRSSGGRESDVRGGRERERERDREKERERDRLERHGGYDVEERRPR